MKRLCDGEQNEVAAVWTFNINPKKTMLQQTVSHA